MEEREKNIVIKVLDADTEYNISTFTGEYRNLMMLLKDKTLVEGFGECGGMGRCATCMIEVISMDRPLAATQRNEDSTIKKAGITDPAIRLSCQLLVDEHLDNGIIRISQD